MVNRLDFILPNGQGPEMAERYEVKVLEERVAELEKLVAELKAKRK
jgi:polyhydroxyalkanoate synthesis regulator phasin